jgi:hypothetical protein
VDRIITKRSRVVVAAGYNHLDNTEYLLVYPQLHLKLGEVAFGLGVPLNIEIFNSNYPSDPAAQGDNHIIQFRRAGTVRKQDWDQPSDFARVLTFLTYGKKEDRVYLDVGQQHASTIGHGSIVRRYQRQRGHQQLQGRAAARRLQRLRGRRAHDQQRGDVGR